MEKSHEDRDHVRAFSFLFSSSSRVIGAQEIFGQQRNFNRLRSSKWPSDSKFRGKEFSLAGGNLKLSKLLINIVNNVSKYIKMQCQM